MSAHAVGHQVKALLVSMKTGPLIPFLGCGNPIDSTLTISQFYSPRCTGQAGRKNKNLTSDIILYLNKAEPGCNSTKSLSLASVETSISRQARRAAFWKAQSPSAG
jgi:hypothetical protein